MMKVLVTGATSGLGRNAVDFLLAKGVSVVATGRNLAAGREIERCGAKFVPCDLSALDLKTGMALVYGVDAVWHCAALSAPWGRAADFIACNVTATENLLAAAVAAGVSRFVHVSTPAIYFDFRHLYDVPETFRARHHVNAYAATKARSEEAVLASAAANHGTLHVMLRPRAIFGPHDAALIPRVQRVLAERGGRLPLPRAGRAVIDVTYVENVLHAMWLASTVPNLESGSVFNITNGDPREIGSVLKTLFTGYLGLAVDIRPVPYWAAACAAGMMEAISLITRREPALTRYSVGALSFDMTLDISKVRKALGYAPVVGIEEGIARTAEWMRCHG